MSTNSTTRQTIALFWYHATRYPRLLFPLFITMPLTVLVMDFARPYIIADALQKISQGNFNQSDPWETFLWHVVLYALTSFMSGVVGYRLNNWFIWNLELKVLRDIAQRVFKHLMNMSAGFHANRFAGSLVSQSNKLVGAYIRFVDTTIFNLYPLIVAIVAAITILWPRATFYSVVLSVLSVIYIIGTVYFSRPVREANTLEAEAQSKQTGNLADSISNIMAVKSFAAGDYENKRYWKTASHTRDMGLRSMRTTIAREIYASIVTTSIGVAAITIAIISAGAYRSDLSTLFLIVSYTAAIGHRLWEFQNVLRQYNRAFGDASDMVKILQIESDIKDPAVPEKPRIKKGDIELENVIFTHNEASEPLFVDLNLSIKAGEKIGLVGHSGGGKTTLTKLLLRYVDIDSGVITIDGQDIRNIKQDVLRRHIAYVPQEPLLFHRTLSENIAYGQSDASQVKIEKFAKMAHAHDFIKDLPNGYDTLVGERGVKLSGGQRQRVAIARAMIKDAPILVLDEATSALDSESEKLIQDALWKLMEGRTAIVIAHRLSTVQRMDRIVVLDDGKIVEQGTHKELIAQDGVYSSLWKHQSGGFLED